MKKTATLVSLLLLGTGILTCAQTKTGFHVLKSHKISSDGGWDYITVDHSHNRIYVSHASRVNILNESTGDSVGIIPNTTGVHGIAIAYPFGKGYTSNGKLGNCTVFDLNNYEILKQISVGENPDALFYDEFSKKLIVFNGNSQNASIINPVNDKVIATVALGGKPEAGVSDGRGTIFVNLEDKNEIVSFDSKTFKIKNRYHLKNGEEPSGLAIDKSNSRLFTVCSNKLMVILNAKNGHEIASLPIGDHCDGVVFDPALKRAYSSNGEGTITIVKELGKDQYQVLEEVKTAPGARTIALDPITHHLFLPTSDLGPAVPHQRVSRIPNTFRILEVGK